MTGRDELERRYEAMLATLGAGRDRHPLHFAPRHDGSPHVSVEPGGTYMLAFSERGQIFDEQPLLDLDELLYRLAAMVVGQEAGAYELRNREPGRDFRRIDFARRLELMSHLSPAWRERLQRELDDILQRHPYSDDETHASNSGWRANAPALLVIAALVLLWAALHWPWWSTRQEQRYLEEYGIATEARLTERSVTQGRFANTYRLSYRFRAEGRWFESSDQVGWHDYRRHEPLDYVSIVFAPEEPSRTLVSGNDRAGRLGWITAFTDALILSILLGGWLRSLKKRRNNPL
ncbi:MAG: hypothetical protein KDE55_00675 [Novosphingobium sp.]|nr:hypothetical protein [Novosphingobium sp.]